MKKIICIVGTRPEAIKMMPIILELKERSNVDVKILATAQHRDLLDQVFDLFGIKPDIDLNLMEKNQTLTKLSSRLLIELDQVFEQEQPDIVLAQGDTTSVMIAAMVCFYKKIKFGHVEAGLRTGDIYSPYPEEANRIIASLFAEWHFAPTLSTVNNLEKENIDKNKVYLTGNTVIDALRIVSSNPNIDFAYRIDKQKKYILLTTHRRENFGENIANIFSAIKEIATKNANVEVIYPVHPNPNINKFAYEFFSGVKNITLTNPLSYEQFICVMKNSFLILTDSGGIQEEAPALGKPVLVLRSETERPEAIAAGVAELVGTDTNIIVKKVQDLLESVDLYRNMVRKESPYGDGFAARKIVNILLS